MKYPAIYGAIATLISALLTLFVYFIGKADDPANAMKDLVITGPIWFLGFAASVTLTVLSIRAWRNAQPDGAMSYGRGVGQGALIGLCVGVFRAVFMVLYAKVINPAFFEAAKAMQAQQLASAPPGARGVAELFGDPVVQALMGIVTSTIGGTVVGLIAAAVLKRAPASPTASPGSPPAVPTA